MYGKGDEKLTQRYFRKVFSNKDIFNIKFINKYRKFNINNLLIFVKF